MLGRRQPTVLQPVPPDWQPLNTSDWLDLSMLRMGVPGQRLFDAFTGLRRFAPAGLPVLGATMAQDKRAYAAAYRRCLRRRAPRGRRFLGTWPTF